MSTIKIRTLCIIVALGVHGALGAEPVLASKERCAWLVSSSKQVKQSPFFFPLFKRGSSSIKELANRSYQLHKQVLSEREAKLMARWHEALLRNSSLDFWGVADQTDASDYLDEVVWMISEAKRVLSDAAYPPHSQTSLERRIRATFPSRKSLQKFLKGAQLSVRQGQLTYGDFLRLSELFTGSRVHDFFTDPSKNNTLGITLLVPTHQNLLTKDFNRVWEAGVAYLGLLSPDQTLEADGTLFGPMEFFFHDGGHGGVSLSAQTDPGRTLEGFDHLLQQRALRIEMMRSAQEFQSHLSKEEKKFFELVIFCITHEEGKIVITEIGPQSEGIIFLRAHQDPSLRRRYSKKEIDVRVNHAIQLHHRFVKKWTSSVIAELSHFSPKKQREILEWFNSLRGPRGTSYFSYLQLIRKFWKE